MIKGYRDGLLANMPEGDWSAACQDLLQQIREKNGFFRGARMAVDAGAHVLHAAEMGGLRNDLAEAGVILGVVISTSPQTAYTARMLGLSQGLRPEAPVSNYTPIPAEEARIISSQLLAGMHYECVTDLVIMGDVPAGVQLESGGSILVWGSLRGSVHAGLGSNEGAVISALDLRPSVLRIAGMLYSGWGAAIPGPRTAFINNGRIILSSLLKMKRLAS